MNSHMETYDIEALKRILSSCLENLPRRPRPTGVGGSVRDDLLGLPIKDWDLVICGVPLARLEDQLAARGDVVRVGRHFGVLKFLPRGWHGPRPLDVALPRRETFGGGGPPRLRGWPSTIYCPSRRTWAGAISPSTPWPRDLATGTLVDPPGRPG